MEGNMLISYHFRQMQKIVATTDTHISAFYGTNALKTIANWH